MPRATMPWASRSEMRSRSAKLSRSSPATTASLPALSAEKALKNAGSVAGKFVPVALHIGPFDLRWYSLAYLAGIFIGYWYLLKLLKQPGAPMARRHADDLVFYAALGVIFGGRLGYVLFYNLGEYLRHPIEILKLWDGGMSFHGGVIGTSLGIFYFAHKQKLPWLRVHDYVACCAPFGFFLVRLANFVNQELWGAPSSVPWAVRFQEYNLLGQRVLGP